MDREIIINRVLRDMKQFELIAKDVVGDIREGEARFFLNVLYTAAWESRKKDYNISQERPVIQEDRDHKFLKMYPSMVIARNVVGMSKTGMIDAIKYKKLTRKGYYFKYAEDGKS